MCARVCPCVGVGVPVCACIGVGMSVFVYVCMCSHRQLDVVTFVLTHLNPDERNVLFC